MNQTSIDVLEIGSFSCGGQIASVHGREPKRVKVARNGPDRIVDLNGDYIAGQCYVQFTRLLKPKYPYPLMLWHGGAMTGATWESTPDGRPGWQMFFLRQGFDTYNCDAFERGRAGSAPYPEVYKEAPIYRNLNEAWSLFRMGPKGGYSTDLNKRKIYAGQQFPVAYFEQLGAQFVPRWTNHGQESLSAYYEAMEKVGPVVIVSHSQGANLAMEAAQKRPDLIKALVLIEPAAAPQLEPADLHNVVQVPHLFVWGDFTGDDGLWSDYRAVADEYAQQLAAAGGVSDTLDLPAQGICGNSHVPMMDRNSDQVAQHISDWLFTQHS